MFGFVVALASCQNTTKQADTESILEDSVLVCDSVVNDSI